MIALSHGGTTTYSSSSPSDELIVATADGVVVLKRSVRNDWAVAHRALPGCHVSSIVIPEPGLMFAGVFHDVVYMSTDSGRTWSRRGDGMTQKNVYSLLSIKNGASYRIYAGTQPAHLFYSDDLGISWNELPGLRAVPSLPRWIFPVPPHEAHVKHIVAAPDNVSILYACIEQGALLKSLDAGVTWHELGGVDDDVHFLSIDPGDARRLYISSGVGCYSSVDGGDSWRRITESDDPVGAYPDTLVRRPANPDLLFLGAARTVPAVWRKTHRSDSQLNRSRDGGNSWERPDGFPHDLTASIQALTLEDCGSTMALYFGTTAGEVLASRDGGVTWEEIASGLAPISKYGLNKALQGI